MNRQLLDNQKQLMAQYKKDCMTIGQQVVLRKAEELSYGTALDLDPDGGLIVQFQDGTIQTVSSGEISVRGMYGYV
jgi:BirA family biotin operon repressor/biotin-[acetyl-CoA-carboxylase] ligase